jgi:hypothetical protein
MLAVGHTSGNMRSEVPLQAACVLVASHCAPRAQEYQVSNKLNDPMKVMGQ